MTTAETPGERVLELYQTEWCPASRRVRQRLTELDAVYLARQVPVEREARTELRERTGTDTIPAAIAPDGTVLVGEEEILAYLDRSFEETPAAEEHRIKATKARKRELEEAVR